VGDGGGVSVAVASITKVGSEIGVGDTVAVRVAVRVGTAVAVWVGGRVAVRVTVTVGVAVGGASKRATAWLGLGNKSPKPVPI
jgi:hypothetical protein